MGAVCVFWGLTEDMMSGIDGASFDGIMPWSVRYEVRDIRLESIVGIMMSSLADLRLMKLIRLAAKAC